MGRLPIPVWVGIRCGNCGKLIATPTRAGATTVTTPQVVVNARKAGFLQLRLPEKDCQRGDHICPACATLYNQENLQ